MEKFKIKIILMDDTTSEVFDEGGLRKVRREDEKYGLGYEVVEKVFATDAEVSAYVEALQDLTFGCWSQYAILRSSHSKK